MSSAVESLNAGVAAGVTLYEIARSARRPAEPHTERVSIPVRPTSRQGRTGYGCAVAKSARASNARLNQLRAQQQAASDVGG